MLAIVFNPEFPSRFSTRYAIFSDPATVVDKFYFPQQSNTTTASSHFRRFFNENKFLFHSLILFK